MFQECPVFRAAQHDLGVWYRLEGDELWPQPMCERCLGEATTSVTDEDSSAK